MHLTGQLAEAQLSGSAHHALAHDTSSSTLRRAGCVCANCIPTGKSASSHTIFLISRKTCRRELVTAMTAALVFQIAVLNVQH